MTAAPAAPPAQQGATPPRPPRGGGLTIVGWLRWGWRQLTSMRTALVLLFLLAVASVPGSLLPQQGIDPAAVQQYYASHPALAPWLARLSLFNVFAAPRRTGRRSHSECNCAATAPVGTRCVG